MRYEQKYEIGDVGAVYEFDVKLPVLYPDVPLLSDAQLEADTEVAVEEFAEVLRKRYKWVGEVYLTGRSNGWLAVVDAKGGATERALKTIHGLVDAAYERFVKDLRDTYGKLHLRPSTDPEFKKRVAFFSEHDSFPRAVGHRIPTAVLLAHAEEVAESLQWDTEWDEDPDGADSLGDVDPATVSEILVATLKDTDGEVLASLGSITDPDRNERRVVAAQLALEALEQKGLL
jgi:hypothetical protein